MSIQQLGVETLGEGPAGFTVRIFDGTGEVSLCWPGRREPPGVRGREHGAKGDDDEQCDLPPLSRPGGSSEAEDHRMIAPEYTLVARLGKND